MSFIHDPPSALLTSFFHSGGAGFVGTNVANHLLSNGHTVILLDNLSRTGVQHNLEWLQRKYADRVQFIRGDIRDAQIVCEALNKVEQVYHFAAQVAVTTSLLKPLDDFDINVRGTLNLCQAARAAGVRRFIHTSTSEVYGTARYVPMDENHPLAPQSPYSASKIAADAMARSFFYSFGLPVVVARPFNVYGPRQSARAVIPTIISQLVNGASEVRLGDLDALPVREEGRHGAGGPDSRAHADPGRAGRAGPRGGARGAAGPLVAPAESPRPLLADRPGVRPARVAVLVRGAEALPRAPDAGELNGSVDWLWMSLSRAGRAAEAKALLDRRPDSLPTNVAYATRLKLYRGQISPDSVFTRADTADVQMATLAYGLGNWYLVRGDTARARSWFERSVRSGGWPGFGFIVSEVEVRGRRKGT